MSKNEFNSILQIDKRVLIKFYADWCAPCEKMKPTIVKVKNAMKEKVLVYQLNAEENQVLIKELKISVLPMLLLYENKSLIWQLAGSIDEAVLMNQLQK